MTGSGQYVEIQGNAEHKPFSQNDLNRLLLAARQGIRQMLAIQKKVLGEITR